MRKVLTASHHPYTLTVSAINQKCYPYLYMQGCVSKFEVYLRNIMHASSRCVYTRVCRTSIPKWLLMQMTREQPSHWQWCFHEVPATSSCHLKLTKRHSSYLIYKSIWHTYYPFSRTHRE